jgi:16S rRNA (uracil1498-N3)-methyltransferase
MNFFYVPEIQSETVYLSEQESLHAIKVLRLKENDPVTLVDGKGNFCTGVITIPHFKRCMITIHSAISDYDKRGYFFHLAVAPPKNNERTDWLLEKATEIGLDAFTPLECRFSERKQLNRERLLKIAVAAMKQSQKAFLPQIDGIRSFSEFVQIPFIGSRYIAHCYPGEKPLLQKMITPNSNILVLIGPEGDFSPEEIADAKHNGFKEVTLGKARLRTETAAIVACLTAALANQ